MVRVPAGFHPFAQSGAGGRPRSVVTPAVPFEQFNRVVSGVPLQPAQAQTILAGAAGAGAGQVTLGPTGLGTVWYPTQVTVSTTSGINDTSTFELYIGPVGIPITLVGTLFPGNGTVALAIPNLAPGLYLIGSWTGGNPGDVAAMNVVGTMSAMSA